MATLMCPYKLTSQVNTIQARACSRELCTIWNEYLEMCSHKATSLLLFDIHQVIVKLGLSQGLIPSQEGEENGKATDIPNTD